MGDCEYCEAGSKPYWHAGIGKWAHEGGVLCQTPKGSFRCGACGKAWDGSQLQLYPSAVAPRWVCGDEVCFGAVERIVAAA